MKRVVELKLLIPPTNKHRYVFVNEEYDEVVARKLDYQAALAYIQDRYFGIQV